MRPDADEGEKRTNEIGTIVPLLETLPDIAGLTVTADALLIGVVTTLVVGGAAVLGGDREAAPSLRRGIGDKAESQEEHRSKAGERSGQMGS